MQCGKTSSRQILPGDVAGTWLSRGFESRLLRAYCVRRTIWSRTAWKAVSSCATSPA